MNNIVGKQLEVIRIPMVDLLDKFKRIDEFNAKRRVIALRYNEGLKGAAGITTPDMQPANIRSAHVPSQQDKGTRIESCWYLKLGLLSVSASYHKINQVSWGGQRQRIELCAGFLV